MGLHSTRSFDWVGDWSGRRATLTPDRVGLVDRTTGDRFTYRELDDRANRTARLLRDYGVESGDRVAVLSRNRPELVDLFFATGKLGAVLAPLSHRLAAPELGALLADVDPELLVVEAPFDELAAAVVDAANLDAEDLDALGGEDADALGTEGLDALGGEGAEVEHTADLAIACEVLSLSTAESAGTWRRFDEARPADASPVDRADVSLSDPHLFLHTGGSTGTPKEVVVSHGSVLWNSLNTITAWGLRDDDVTPMVFPTFHTGGWNVITLPLFHMGGTVIIAREFDAGDILRTIEDEGATTLIAVPAQFRMMVEHDEWETANLSTLRFAKSGGGPARESVMKAWWSRGVELSQGYGLTECGPNNFAMPDDWPRSKADTVGKPAMHVDARIVDDDGAPVPDGEIGELELAGLHAATEYWRNPEESAETFGGGWVSTGDLARRDADGYFSIEGRKKNLFVSGGENVYPPEVEDAIAAHPAVDEVVVVPIPDEQWGQVGKAVIEGDDSLTLPELREFLDDRLARFKHPRELAFVDAMPTSGPSKIDRQAIEDAYGGGST